MHIGIQNWIVRIHLSSTNESTWTSSTGRTSRSRSGRAIERVPRGCSTIGVQKGVVSIRTRSRDKEPTTGATGGDTRSRRGSTSARVGSGGETVHRKCARLGVISVMESEVVKGGRVVSVDNQSDLRRLGMERLRERLVKFPLHFMVEGGVGGGNKLINVGFAGKGEF